VFLKEMDVLIKGWPFPWGKCVELPYLGCVAMVNLPYGRCVGNGCVAWENACVTIRMAYTWFKCIYLL